MRYPDTAVVVRTERQSPLGADAPIPGEGETRTPIRGLFAPGSTSEDTLQRGSTVYSTATFYAEPDADVRRTDRLETEGRLWAVDGDPMAWRSPVTGRRPGLQVNLRSVRG